MKGLVQQIEDDFEDHKNGKAIPPELFIRGEVEDKNNIIVNLDFPNKNIVPKIREEIISELSERLKVNMPKSVLSLKFDENNNPIELTKEDEEAVEWLKRL